MAEDEMLTRIRELERQIERDRRQARHREEVAAKNFQKEIDKLEAALAKHKMGGHRQDQMDTAIDALGSIRLFRSYYASSRPAALHIQSVVKVLRSRDADNGPYGGLLHNLADAIAKAYLGQPASLVTGEPDRTPDAPGAPKSEPPAEDDA